jgi:hypothetical protein
MHSFRRFRGLAGRLHNRIEGFDDSKYASVVLSVTNGGKSRLFKLPGYQALAPLGKKTLL